MGKSFGPSKYFVAKYSKYDFQMNKLYKSPK